MREGGNGKKRIALGKRTVAKKTVMSAEEACDGKEVARLKVEEGKEVQT